ncbi:MAG: TIGR00282 family metallophosphoesterase [Clostridiales bacterium]|nr:TIGR00282 family metallophosphoesterase [Clostridiales bacterium]
MRILFIGDVFGDLGVKAIETYLPRLRAERGIDFCVANGENAATRGTGLSRAAADALFRYGVDVITLGNHTWKDKDVFSLIKENERVIRPANWPEGNPGAGAVLVQTPEGPVGVVNLLGRLYMDSCDCPFAAADRELARLRERARVILVDLHAEATSEKCAFAYHVDGRASLVVGTHTHVQTADERILPGGTAFLTDAGMTGPADGVIGVSREPAVRRFRTQIPERFSPAVGRRQLNAVIADVDPDSGKAETVERVRIISDAL